MTNSKKYRVIAYFDYAGMPLESTLVVRYFSHYWTANLYSWCLHHLMGYNCNTWKYDGKEKEDLAS